MAIREGVLLGWVERSDCLRSFFSGRPAGVRFGVQGKHRGYKCIPKP